MAENKELTNFLDKSLVKVYTPTNAMYRSQLLKLIKTLQQQKISVILISTVQCYQDLKDEFKKFSIDENSIYVVDTQSKKLMRDVQSDICFFVDSPADLNSIVSSFSTIKKVSEKKSKAKSVLIFDNINNLLLDSKKPMVYRFIYNFLSRLRKENLPALFVLLKQASDDELLSLLDSIGDGELSVAD